MGRTRRLEIFARLSDTLNFVRTLLEGRHEETLRSPWILDSLEKVITMWPPMVHGQSDGDTTFAHLRRLYRYGFRLTIAKNSKNAKDGLRLRQFFADGEIYRPEGYSQDSAALLADLAHLAQETNPLRPGQCRIARARPVLKALGFPDLDSPDSFAIQFAWPKSERWIFIDSRPELFRRETASGLALKLASSSAIAVVESRDEGPSL
ncbi:hypothetical protein BH10BDE1_BH10BDE1_00800 [soil metagenome]